jgi:DEAD/DEAH box helicase domain-containing protein
LLVYNPPVVNAELGIRASYLKAPCGSRPTWCAADVPTLVFGPSRNGVEVMLKYLRDAMADGRLTRGLVMAYRGGYLPDARGASSRGLRDGDIRCVVATNALELGIDIGALDAVVCAGYPGSIAGLWQRFGRAGRRQEQQRRVLVTSSRRSTSTWRATRAALGGARGEARIDPDNVEILIQHLKCAAFELPFEATRPLATCP